MYMFEFKMPGRIRCVDGGATKLGKLADRLGAAKILIVTDRGVRDAGLVEPVVDGLDRGESKVVGVFDEVPPDPGVGTIERCAAMAGNLGADGIVSIGGGSPIDTAKASLIQLCEGGNLLDYEWNEYFASSPPLPHIAIPTTAGTGSEATHVAMVTDETRRRKLMYQGGDLLPRAAILDPRMTVSLPPSVTASTGIDALGHGIEAMHSILHEPMADSIAIGCIGLVGEHLEKAFRDGEDTFARMNMLIAADMGGMAAANGYIGIVHAAAHTIGALYHIPHGVAVAVMLPYAMEMNMGYAGIDGIYVKVATALGLDVDRGDEKTSARKAVERVRELMATLELPTGLRDLGIPESELGAITDETMEDRPMLVTPGNPSREEVLELFEKAY